MQKKRAHKKAHSEDIYGQRKNGTFHSNIDKYFERKIGAEIFEDITLGSSEIFGASQQKVQQIEQQASRDKNFLKFIKRQFKNNKKRWDSKYRSAACLHNFQTSPSHENPKVWKQMEESYNLEVEINQIILKNFKIKSKNPTPDTGENFQSGLEASQNENPKKKLVDVVLKNPKLFNTKHFASLRKQRLNSTEAKDSKNCRSVLSAGRSTGVKFKILSRDNLNERLSGFDHRGQSGELSKPSFLKGEKVNKKYCSIISQIKTNINTNTDKAGGDFRDFQKNLLVAHHGIQNKMHELQVKQASSELKHLGVADFIPVDFTNRVIDKNSDFLLTDSKVLEKYGQLGGSVRGYAKKGDKLTGF